MIKARKEESERLDIVRRSATSKATTQNVESEVDFELASDASVSDNSEDEDGKMFTQSTNVTKVAYVGILNNKKFLKSLEFAQKSQMVAARANVSRLETLVERINNSGGSAFEKFVRDLEEQLDSLKDTLSFVTEKSNQLKIKEVLNALKALALLVGPRNSIGCLQHITKWLQLASTKNVIGSEKSENLVFTLNLQSKRNRSLFQCKSAELNRWKTRREIFSTRPAPYVANRGSFSGRGYRGGRNFDGNRGGFSGSWNRGGRGGQGRGGDSKGGAPAYQSSNSLYKKD